MLSALAKSTAPALRRATTTSAAPAANALVRRSAALPRFMSTEAVATTPQKYGGSIRLLHWAMAGSIGGTIVFVQLAQNTKDNKEKGDYMFYHKSCGLLTAILLPARFAARLTSAVPAALPGPMIQQLAGSLSHLALYGLMVVMPVTGIAMGYYSGKGLPFFFTTVPGADEADGALAKQNYLWHKQAGWWLQYIVLPLHIGAAGFHALKGDKIFRRIL